MSTETALRADRAFLGHPLGLGFLSFAEAWERFSFYGMQALLVLYMGQHLLLPGQVEKIAGFEAFRGVIEGAYGKLSPVALASAIFGLYAGGVYLTPIAGGVISDRWLGRHRAVVLGGLIMALGHFMMASEALFFPAMATIAIGNGLFLPNLPSQVGALYAEDDPRRASAYNLYYVGINLGATLAPLVCGTLGEVYGWHWGFGAAGVGMCLGLVVYLAGGRWLPHDGPRTAAPST